MFLEDQREFPKILSLKRPDRCNNYPCRAPRNGHDIYCARCRTEMTAAIEWLRLEIGESAA